MRFLDRLNRRALVALSTFTVLLGLTGAGYAAHVGHWFSAATVATRVTAGVSSSQSSTLDLGTAAYAPNLSYSQALTDGTGNGAFKIIFADSGTIAASDSVLLDLAGSQTDAFGATITCATLKGIMVTAKSTNTNDVLVGGARVAQVDFLGNGLGGAGDTNHLVPVGPGGVFLLLRPNTGATVTATTRDIIRIKNSGGTTGVGYSIQALCR